MAFLWPPCPPPGSATEFLAHMSISDIKSYKLDWISLIKRETNFKTNGTVLWTAQDFGFVRFVHNSKALTQQKKEYISSCWSLLVHLKIVLAARRSVYTQFKTVINNGGSENTYFFNKLYGVLQLPYCSSKGNVIRQNPLRLWNPE